MNEELVSVLTEELRSGLSSILGYSRTLELRGGRLTEAEQTEFASRISVQAEQLARLVDYLHAAARAESEPSQHQADASAVVRAVATELTDVISAHRVDARLNLAPSLRASVSEYALQQVVASLVLAALQATSDGAQLLLSTRARRDRVVVEIAATGARPDARRRLDALTSTAPWDAASSLVPGGELGLSLVRPLVEAHDGYLTVDLDGEAVTLCIEVPRVANASQVPERTQAARPPSSGDPGPPAVLCG